MKAKLEKIGKVTQNGDSCLLLEEPDFSIYIVDIIAIVYVCLRLNAILV